MKDIINKALEFSMYKETIHNQLEFTKEKLNGALTIYHKGGRFVIDKPLMNWIDLLIRKGYDDYVITDIQDRPIKIENLNDFLNNILSQHSSAMNEYINEYERIKNSRTVDSIVELSNESKK